MLDTTWLPIDTPEAVKQVLSQRMLKALEEEGLHDLAKEYASGQSLVEVLSRGVYGPDPYKLLSEMRKWIANVEDFYSEELPRVPTRRFTHDDYELFVSSLQPVDDETPIAQDTPATSDIWGSFGRPLSEEAQEIEARWSAVEHESSTSGSR